MKDIVAATAALAASVTWFVWSLSYSPQSKERPQKKESRSWANNPRHKKDTKLKAG